MNIKFLLLAIGLLAIAAAIFGIFAEWELMDILLGMVSGSALVYGYFSIDQAAQNDSYDD